jgi:outer membrane protein OmpA-like peptidoglycan-associated protein
MQVRQTLLIGVAAAALAAPADAAHFKGWYVSIEGGASWIEDADALHTRTVNGALASSDTDEASFDTGWALFASAGYAFANNWRVEAEFGYRRNGVSAVFLIFDSFQDLVGDVEEYSLMANVLYDVPLTERLALTIGAGAGADNVRFDGSYLSFAGPVAASGDTWKFAVQGLAGFSYALSRGTDLTLTYRYLHVPGPEFTQSGFVSVIPLSQTVAFDDLAKHSVSVGLRFDLSSDQTPPAPPAAPPPPPPPPPDVKQFIIFFGFDRCDITDEADRVLGEAAAAARATGSASVRVVGHTDTSGSPAYNQRLSECRAGAAKNNLVGKGIPERAISTSGRGEGELMVQTGDGVKEPQNRRATVDLQ